MIPAWVLIFVGFSFLAAISWISFRLGYEAGYRRRFPNFDELDPEPEKEAKK